MSLSKLIKIIQRIRHILLTAPFKIKYVLFEEGIPHNISTSFTFVVSQQQLVNILNISLCGNLIFGIVTLHVGAGSIPGPTKA